MKSILEKQENLDVRQLEVIDIEVEDGKVVHGGLDFWRHE